MEFFRTLEQGSINPIHKGKKSDDNSKEFFTPRKKKKKNLESKPPHYMKTFCLEQIIICRDSNTLTNYYYYKPFT